MRIHSIFTTAALIAGICIPAAVNAAEDVFQSRKISNLEYGVFCALQDMKSMPAPDTAAGWIHNPNAQPVFHWQTLTVPAAKNIGFGIQARAKGRPITDAKIVVTHPSIKGSRQDSWATNFHRNSITTDFYRFDFGYELKPGDWTIQAVKDGEVLYSVKFRVVAAANVPEITKACHK